jgi:hypothetical protein
LQLLNVLFSEDFSMFLNPFKKIVVLPQADKHITAVGGMKLY